MPVSETHDEIVQEFWRQHSDLFEAICRVLEQLSLQEELNRARMFPGERQS